MRTRWPHSLCLAALLTALLPLPGEARRVPDQAPAALAAEAERLAKSDPAAAIRMSEEALARASTSSEPAIELRLLAALAEARAAQGDTPATREAAERWLAAAEDRGSAADKAAATIHLGWFHARAAEYDQALARFVGALGSDGLRAHPRLRALALHGIGRVHASRDDPARAVPHLEEARRLFEEAGDTEGRAEVTSALGVAAGMRNDLQAAEAYFRDAMVTFRALGRPRLELVQLANLAVVRDSRGDPKGALEDFRAALALARRLRSPQDEALALNNIGETLVKLGRPAEAVAHFDQSLAISRAQSARQMQAWSHENLSAAYEQLGEYKRALEHARRFRELHDVIHSEESDAKFAEMETRYRTEARERENERLRAEIAVQQAERRRNVAIGLALAAGLALVSLALAGLVGRHLVMRRHNRALAASHAVITRQKAEVESLRDELEVRVALRTEQLARSNEELRAEIAQRQRVEAEKERLQAHYLQAQKMEAIGLMAGGVAHDFNNILTGIGMSCELALTDSPPDSPHAAAFRDVLELSQRAARLTRQLLAFSRKQLLQPSEVHLHELIGHTLRMLNRIIGEDIQVEFRPGAGPDIVEADASQIEQVIVNLAVNARDAMPQGGTLVLETALEQVDGQILLSGEDPLPAGPYVALRVIDTGIGMDAETVRHIFEPFFTTKPASRGTGLGLSTVYGVVRQHRGAVQVVSAPGAGTTFTILLPLLRERPAAAGG